MFGEGSSGTRAAIIILIISTSVRCQDFNVFVAQNNNTADKRAKVSEPLMKNKNFQGYSICFREPSKVDKINYITSRNKNFYLRTDLSYFLVIGNRLVYSSDLVEFRTVMLVATVC